MSRFLTVVSVVACAAAAGCYADLRGGVEHAGGGVQGWGWELAGTAGFGFDFGHVASPSVGADVSMTRIKNVDGKFGSTGVSYHARGDLTIGASMVGHDEVAAAHPGMEIPDGDVLSLTRLIFDYGYGKEELSFVGSDQMTYTSRSSVHRMYLGIAKEYEANGVRASFSIGPNVMLIPNDFVGDTTIIGGQFHTAFWFFPEFHRRPSGPAIESGYVPSEASRPLPTRTCTSHTITECSTGQFGRTCSSHTVCD